RQLAQLRDYCFERAESRCRVATAAAFTAVMAGGAAVMTAGDYGIPHRDQWDLDLLATGFQSQVAPPHRRRGQKDAIRKACQTFPRPVDSHQGLGAVVVRREVLICDRPVVAITVLHRFRFEINLGHSKADSAPSVGAAADCVDAGPMEVSPR